MTTRQDYIKELLSYLYEAKKNGISRKEINKHIQNLIIKGQSGMFEVIDELNASGYINIIAKKGIGTHFFTNIPEDYLTLKGEEHIESLIKIIQQ